MWYALHHWARSLFMVIAANGVALFRFIHPPIEGKRGIIKQGAEPGGIQLVLLVLIIVQSENIAAEKKGVAALFNPDGCPCDGFPFASKTFICTGALRMESMRSLAVFNR